MWGWEGGVSTQGGVSKRNPEGCQVIISTKEKSLSEEERRNVERGSKEQRIWEERTF